MQEKMILEQEKEIPVILDCDVAVCGGGVAGAAAALSAARNGADVCLLEKAYNLGGMATLGLITFFLPLCDSRGHQMIGGIPEEFFRLAVRYGPGKVPECWEKDGDPEQRKKKVFTAEFNPAWFSLGLEQLLLDAGVRIVYDTRLCSVVKDGDRVSALIVENKSGRGAVTCRAAVDCTGDADLCHLAGEETVSLNTNRRAGWFYSYDGQKVKLNVVGDIFHQPVPKGSMTFAGDNWEDVTGFVIDSHTLILEKVDKMRGAEGGENTVPLIVPTLPQFRKTRRLKGLYELHVTDQKTYFGDSIGMTGYYRVPGLVIYYPYRALVGGKTANVLAAGRCISCLEPAWNISRGIPSCSITGQAAGAAAAMLVRDGVRADQVDVKKLRETLLSQKVIIDPSYAEKTSD